MEPETISKNGVSPKNQRSRGNKSRNFYWFFSISIALMMFSGCSTKIPMTTKIINEVGGVENSKKFQYYVSKQITLTRVSTTSSSTIEGGTLVRRGSTARDKIVIRGNLPGLVRRGWKMEKDDGFMLYVAFEEYEGNPQLGFRQYIEGVSTDPYKLGYAVPEESIVQYGSGSDRYKVSYDNKKHTGQPYLLIKMKRSYTKSAKARRAKGLKLD